MKLKTSGFLIVLLLGLSACNKIHSSTLSPSIEALEGNEKLIMIYSACHWGCNEGIVTFKGNTARLKSHEITLTEREVTDLDAYFNRGNIPGEVTRCSMPIEIGFRLKKGLKTLNSKETQIYPCTFGHDDRVTPEALVHHFLERPNETPSWRLSREKRNELLSLED